MHVLIILKQFTLSVEVLHHFQFQAGASSIGVSDYDFLIFREDFMRTFIADF